MTWSRIRSFIIAEVKEVVPPVVFFAVSFNLVVLTTQLILDDYGGQFANFLVATTAALVVGKAGTNGECAAVPPPLRWGALIQPILFKTVVYVAVVFLFRFLEKLVEYVFSGGALGGIPDYVREHFTWHRFIAIQIWMFVLFLVYTTVSELNHRFDGELAAALFTRRSRDPRLPSRR